jgi:hypothetical protein
LDTRRLVLAGAALILASLGAVLGFGGCLSKPETGISKSSGQTLYVSNTPDCAGRSPCHASIQDALDVASDGDVIKVASGVYTATASQVVSIQRAVRLVGGYQLDDWSLPRSNVAPAVLDAEGVAGRRGVYIDGRGVSTITVEGFHIRRGGFQVPEGGGGYVAGGTVVLEDNLIEACTVEARGGALFVADGSVHLRRNTIRGNAAQYGGGLYVEAGNVVLERNILMDNEAPPMGGAIAIAGGGVDGANNLVVENALAGAGIYLSGGHLTASHWTLVDNGRYAIIADLGVDIESGSVTLNKSIVASHEGGLCGAGVVARQTLFHRVDRPCIAGASCVSNLFGDPSFIDPLTGDYHISADSPAVDQGHSLDVGQDMDGDIRPVGAASDIGADEIEPLRIYLPLVVRRGGSRTY